MVLVFLPHITNNVTNEKDKNVLTFSVMATSYMNVGILKYVPN